jgi:hypothetical protein
MGITEADISAGTYPCLTGAGTVSSPSYSEEHDGRTLTTSQIMPFSAAQWNAQATATIADRRGKTILGVVDGKPGSVMNANGPFTREVYNIVPTSAIATSPTSDVFVGATSQVCQQSAIIQQYGFSLDANCGSTTLHN